MTFGDIWCLFVSFGPAPHIYQRGERVGEPVCTIHGHYPESTWSSVRQGREVPGTGPTLAAYRLLSRRMAFLCRTSHAPLQHLGAQLGGSLPLYTTDLCQGGRSNDRLAHPAAYAPVEHRPSEEATH